MGVLGTFIAASTLGSVAGVQRASAENVMANLKSIKMGDFNPNYATQWSYRLAQALGYLKESASTSSRSSSPTSTCPA